MAGLGGFAGQVGEPPESCNPSELDIVGWTRRNRFWPGFFVCIWVALLFWASIIGTLRQIPSSIRQQIPSCAMSRRAQTAQPSEVVQRPAQPSRTKTAPAAMGPSAYFRVMMFAEERDKEQEAKEFMRKVHQRCGALSLCWILTRRLHSSALTSIPI